MVRTKKEEVFGMKVLILGGVAGGAGAAARLRRLDENCEIIMIERGQFISFANCGLPYYIGEIITEKEKLLVQTVEGFSTRFKVDVRVNQEVIQIDRGAKAITVKDLITDEIYSESYDKLVISTGASPIGSTIPGADLPNVFTLRDIPDTFRIKDYVDTQKPAVAVVVGGGYIGLEVAENLKHRGVSVIMVEMAEQLVGVLDKEMAAFVHFYLQSCGVDFYLQDGVKAFIKDQKQTKVILTSGREIYADMVVLGIGVRPKAEIARDAGLEIGVTGGIKVNEYLMTSDPDIYAVGDVIEVTDYVNKNPALIPLAGPANKQARIAADNICGRKSKYNGTQGTSVVKVFDMTVAATGNNEKQLKRYGIKYEKSYTHSGSHAGYYPGATVISIKILFDPEHGRLFGAQAIGFSGVEKRMDVFATAIRAGMTVFDLEELELAYAPPFSSAKDPVNMAGYVASNIVRGDQKVMHWHELDSVDRGKTILLDVRTSEEFADGAIPGAVNIPIDVLRSNLDKVPHDKEVVVYCKIGLRAYIAYRILTNLGYENIKNLSGGWTTYLPAVSNYCNIQEDMTI
jgi:NADPH-dependent 2,4-dienoyl-CoA reductase/sulfur reductase-like enzyme/rhodanese-related sulfurtransferase